MTEPEEIWARNGLPGRWFASKEYEKNLTRYTLAAPAEARQKALADALRYAMQWIDNWSPRFTEDPEWPEDEAIIRAALAAHDKRKGGGGDGS